MLRLRVIASVGVQGLGLDVYSSVDTSGTRQSTFRRYMLHPANREVLLEALDRFAIALRGGQPRYGSNLYILNR